MLELTEMCSWESPVENSTSIRRRMSTILNAGPIAPTSLAKGRQYYGPKRTIRAAPWQTDTDNLRFSPLYIRFEPGEGGDWNIERVELAVIAPGNTIHFDRLEGGANLWLGERRGKYLYLR
jgi:hypothetical protein